jgi:hypothetical protein
MRLGKRKFALTGTLGEGLQIVTTTGKKEQNPERQRMMTIAWYAQGVRVLGISGLATFQAGPESVGYGEGVGMREVGHYVMPDTDTLSFKTNKIRKDGPFFGYGNDLARGLRGADRDIAWEGSAAVIVPTLLLAARTEHPASRGDRPD